MSVGGRYRHVRTGGVYDVICYAKRESDGAEMAVYWNPVSEEAWVRPKSEFHDGRFELVREGPFTDPEWMDRD